jgi:hypothetical protein
MDLKMNTYISKIQEIIKCDAVFYRNDRYVYCFILTKTY